MKKQTVKYTTVSIPIPLSNKLKEIISGTGFNSVSSFVVYVLRQIISEKSTESQAITKAEEEKIKERLKNLGYL